jgi:hypothetical protein
MGFRRWIRFIRSTLRNPDRWKLFSEDLEAKGAILLPLEGISRR